MCSEELWCSIGEGLLANLRVQGFWYRCEIMRWIWDRASEGSWFDWGWPGWFNSRWTACGTWAMRSRSMRIGPIPGSQAGSSSFLNLSRYIPTRHPRIHYTFSSLWLFWGFFPFSCDANFYQIQLFLGYFRFSMSVNPFMRWKLDEVCYALNYWWEIVNRG